MYEDAIAELQEVITLVPKSKIAHDAQYWTGQCYFRMGRFDEALSVFEKIIEDCPESAIVPVTQLMIAQVQQEKQNEKLRAKRDAASDEGVIIHPKTGVKYTRTKILTGKKDVIEYAMAGLSLSPNGKFLLWEKLVVPVDGGEPFNLVDMPAWRGSWSPDGKRVAFNSGGAIWVIPVSPETGRPTAPAKKLLDGEYWYQPIVSWSPDSERIVFGRRDKEIRDDIWTLSVRDGTLTQITDDPVWEARPVWSSDGKTIAYNWGDNEIWVVSAEGGTPRKIVGKGCPVSWSPDGKWILYTVLREPCLFRVADERVFDITAPEDIGSFLSWSPDGRKILFYRPSYDERSALRIVSASGGPSFELGRQLNLWAYELFWSPDSRMMIRGGWDQDRDWAFWIMPLAGGDAFLLKLDVSVPGRPSPISLSPDGKKLLFSVRQSEKTDDLWVVPVSLKDGRTTGPAVMVFSGWAKSHGNAFSWSPDGTELAITYKYDIWIVSTEGGEPVQLTSAEDAFWPAWSPDGEMIAYEAHHSEKEKPLKVISVSSGQIAKILDISGGYATYAWSPGGKELTVVSEELISAMPIASGRTRQVVALKDLAVDGAWGLCWSPDGQHLAFIGYKRANESYHIFMVPAEGGEVTELADDDRGDKFCLYWSPDGKWLSFNSDAFVKTRSEGAIWEADVQELMSREE